MTCDADAFDDFFDRDDLAEMESRETFDEAWLRYLEAKEQ